MELAENRARRHIPMTMEDWARRIDRFLLSDDRNILKDAGKISRQIACDKAISEFEKYRIKQDKLYKSDFDLLIEKVEKKEELKVYDVNSNKRPIAVMIDNNVENDEQVGLQDAYLTYEIIVEGGLTRIMAIYKDVDTSVIGPVRSSRHYFLDYALESDAIYAHYGWSTYAENDIKALSVDNINGLYDDAFYRDSSIAAPHNVFTSIDNLYLKAEELGYDTTSSNYENLNYVSKKVDLEKTDNSLNCDGENCSLEGTSLTSIEIPYSNSEVRSYTYDSDNGYYLRYMNGIPHTDRDSKEQYHYKNIIIMKVDNSTLDDYGRQDLDTVGSGEGYYITNGYMMPITWEKDSRSGKTYYSYSNGDEIKVSDGNTFIQVIPSSRDIVIN